MERLKKDALAFLTNLRKRNVPPVFPAADVLSHPQSAEIPLTPEPDPSYRAPYAEFTIEELVSNWKTILEDMLPEEFALPDYNQVPGHLRQRFITLPINEDKRRKRIEEIQAAGTDRTIPGEGCSQYEWASSDTDGRDPLLFLMTDPSDSLIRTLSSRKSLHFFRDEWSKNGLLIYDNMTKKGLTLNPSSYVMSTFQDPARKNEALLGIIYIKAGDGQ